jgi:siroheme synthase-like protein
MKVYYPMFADLAGRECVVVGGGAVAERKVVTLLRYGARITLVSPIATRKLLRATRAGRIRYRARHFRATDLRGAWLVFAATDDKQINELVHRMAERERIFANVVDQTPLCSFIAPSLFRRGPLTIAVSTSGTSPTIAKQLRKELERTVGRSYVPMLRLLASLRSVAKRSLPCSDDRKRYFDALIGGRVFNLVRANRLGQARGEALTLLKRYAQGHGR